MNRKVVKIEDMKPFSELWHDYQGLRDKAYAYIHDLVLQYGKETEEGKRRFTFNKEMPRVCIRRSRSYKTVQVKHIEVFGYEGCFMGYMSFFNEEEDNISQMEFSSFGDWLCIYGAVSLEVRERLNKGYLS